MGTCKEHIEGSEKIKKKKRGQKKWKKKSPENCFLHYTFVLLNKTSIDSLTRQPPYVLIFLMVLNMFLILVVNQLKFIKIWPNKCILGFIKTFCRVFRSMLLTFGFVLI